MSSSQGRKDKRIVLAGAVLLIVGARGASVLASGPRTVEDRVAQFGAVVDARLKPAFAAKGVPYPPAALTLVGLKHEKRLEVWAAGPRSRSAPAPMRLVRSYPILAASGTLGPKLREGDHQVPEGIYRIELLNPNSLFHLSLRVSYPNGFDREQGRRDGRRRLGATS